jgi:ABC-type multidrug transport system fused ATPase/permease subunit
VGRTVLIIAHRLKLAYSADNIVVLDGDVRSKTGHTRRCFRMQDRTVSSSAPTKLAA